jgi:hypothetical protein
MNSSDHRLVQDSPWQAFSIENDYNASPWAGEVVDIVCDVRRPNGESEGEIVLCAAKVRDWKNGSSGVVVVIEVSPAHLAHLKRAENKGPLRVLHRGFSGVGEGAYVPGKPEPPLRWAIVPPLPQLPED